MNPQYKFEVILSYTKDDVRIGLEIVPWWLKPIRLVSYWFSPNYDFLWLIRNKIDGFIYRKTKVFYIPITPENVKEFQAWAGWTSQIDLDDSE